MCSGAPAQRGLTCAPKSRCTGDSGRRPDFQPRTCDCGSPAAVTPLSRRGPVRWPRAGPPPPPENVWFVDANQRPSGLHARRGRHASVHRRGHPAAVSSGVIFIAPASLPRIRHHRPPLAPQCSGQKSQGTQQLFVNQALVNWSLISKATVEFCRCGSVVFAASQGACAVKYQVVLHAEL